MKPNHPYSIHHNYDSKTNNEAPTTTKEMRQLESKHETLDTHKTHLWYVQAVSGVIPILGSAIAQGRA